MKARLIKIGLIALAVMSPVSAFACCTVVDARAAFTQGEFASAYENAAPLPTADAKLIAVQALAATLLLGTSDDPKRTSKTALSLAAQVLEMDPSNKEAQFHYALIDGFVTRSASPFKAYRKKMPQKTKAVIDAFVLAAPEDGRSQALLGAWHMGVLRKAGARNGEKWFGASFQAAETAYETALALRPDDIIISSNYALSLLEYDQDTYSDRTQALLIMATAAQSNDPIEKAVQARMRMILDIWDDPKASLKSAKSFLDGKG